MKPSFWEITTFWILVTTVVVSILRWIYPWFKQWRKNRAYSLSFTESFESKITNKSKTISIGKQGIFIRIEMKSKKYISQVYFHFRKGNGGGFTGASIISFESEGVKVSNMENLPYGSSLESRSQSVVARFTPIQLLKIGEILVFALPIDAKSPWSGRLDMEAYDENGQIITRSLKLKIVEPDRCNMGVKSSTTKNE